MKRKLISILLCSVMVASLLAGCGNKTAKETTKEEPAAVKTEAPVTETKEEPTQNKDIVLKYVSMWSETEPQAVAIKECAEEFKQATGITVNIEFAGRQGVREGLQPRLDAKEEIDIFDEDVDRVTKQWGDYLLDLDKYLDQKYPSTGDKTWRECINPDCQVLLDTAKQASGGVMKVIPYQPFIFEIMYNKDIFAKAGVTEVPKTWTEFLNVCQKIKDAGYDPITVDNAYITCLAGYQLARYMGSEGVIDVVTNGKWDDPAVLKMAKDWQEMYEKGFISQYAATNIYPNAQVTEFAMGTAAMYLNGTWLVNEIKADAPADFKWGTFAYPSVEGGKTGPEAANFGSQVLAINKDSKNPDAAFQFIAWLTTGTGDAKIAEYSLGIPMSGNATWPVQLEDAKKIFSTLTVRYPWAAGIENNSDIAAKLLENFTGVISGEKTAEEFVAAMK